jgi:hypothetical protein
VADATVIRFPRRAPEDPGSATDPSGAERTATWPGASDDESYDWFAHSIVEACRGLDDASERQWLLDALWRSRDTLFQLGREGDSIHPGLGNKLFETLVATLNDELRRATLAEPSDE